MSSRTTRRDLPALAGTSLGDTRARCAATGELSTAPPELVAFNARIINVDFGNPHAEAFGIKNGRFLAVGSNADVRNLIRPGTPTWDGQGDERSSGRSKKLVLVTECRRK